jgi:hypothetical protein
MTNVENKPEYQADLSTEHVAARLNDVKWLGVDNWQPWHQGCFFVYSEGLRHYTEEESRAIVASFDAQRELAALKRNQTPEALVRQTCEEVATLRAQQEQAEQRITALVADREGLEREVERLRAGLQTISENYRGAGAFAEGVLDSAPAALTERPVIENALAEVLCSNDLDSGAIDRDLERMQREAERPAGEPYQVGDLEKFFGCAPDMQYDDAAPTGEPDLREAAIAARNLFVDAAYSSDLWIVNKLNAALGDPPLERLGEGELRQPDLDDREGLEKEVERLSAENERLRRIAIVENQAVGQLRAARTERPAPTGELDLDAIEARIEEWKVTPKIQKGVQLIERDIPALLALVRRLRTEPATGTWAWALVQMCQERQNSTKGRVVHRPGRADVEINDEGVVMSGQPFLAADFDATDWQLTEEEP